MTAVRLLLRIDLRRRWRSLVVLALLIALATTTIMTVLAGARRGASALDRLQERTLPATVMALPNTPGFDWDAVRAMPEVAGVATFVVDYAITADGRPGDVLTPPDTLGFPAGDDEVFRTLEKPVVHQGRLLNPARADEAVVSPKFVQKHHLGVGDYVIVHLPTVAELLSTATGGTVTHPSGPSIRTKIVGVVTAPYFSDSADSSGFLETSPGLGRKYPANVFGPKPDDPQNPNFANAIIRLKGGEAAIPAFQKQLEATFHRSDIDLADLVAQQRETQRHIAFESQCLVAFAAAVFAAALFLIGQAIVRYAAGSANELLTLRGLGMSPRQAVLAATGGPVLVAVPGLLVAVGASIALSPLFPFGTAAYMEPDPGFSLDPLVLVLTPVVLLLLVAGGAALAATTALQAGRRDTVPRRSIVAAWTARAGMSLAAQVGTRFALEPGRGRTAVPVRPALLGAVIGVLGVVAAFTFSHGVSDASRHPERYGQTFQLGGFIGAGGTDFVPASKVAAALAVQPQVSAVTDSRTAVAADASGKNSIALWEFSKGPKPIQVVITSGRMPRAADEVVLAPRTVAAMHTGIGRRVTLSGSVKGLHTYTVTGVGLVPIGPHNSYSDGGWMTSAGYDSLFSGFKFHIQLVALKPGVDQKTAPALLSAAVGKAVPKAQGVEFDASSPPPELAEIRQVRTLPVALGLFLGLLAIAAVGHALATAVRRREHDIAVLRAVGMTRRQSRWVVIVQASVLAVIGLLFGIPLGLALGRTLWRVVATYTPLEYVSPLGFWVMTLIVPLSLLVANLLAAWPGHRAAVLRVAHVLRTE